MDRCDFSSVVTIIRRYISEDKEMSQIDFTYLLFDTFMSGDEAADYDFDNGQVCRWMSGQAKVSPRIVAYYLEHAHQEELAEDIRDHIIPLMYDFPMAVKELYELVMQDSSISEQKKQELINGYGIGVFENKISFMTKALCFGMERNFVKRDTRTKQLLSASNLSPVLLDYVMGYEVPRPCKFFCGRSEELQALHSLFEKDSKVFLYGIAGIGKSELAKAYAREYRKEYTNILYITYGGDLWQDIMDMDFVDDLPQDTDEERFKKHNRFLRSLKEDTLLIVDNFNATPTQDSFLSVMLKYRCRILFTTRSVFDGRSTMQLQEISDTRLLVQLVSCFYSETEKYHATVEQIIDAVHRHTFAVELAARLLENGMLQPDMLLKKLQEENVALDNNDKINMVKDGQNSKATYYSHIHTLFSLYRLSGLHRDIMCNMALIPVTGISVRRFAEWMEFTDMNAVNDLVEMGLICHNPGRILALHPMVQEISAADMRPSIQKCKTLCRSIQQTCLRHGVDIFDHKLLFQIVENIMAVAVKDHMAFYLRFLEDVFP